MKKALTYTAIALAALTATGAAVVAADTLDDGTPLAAKDQSAQDQSAKDKPAKDKSAPIPRALRKKWGPSAPLIEKHFTATASGPRLGVQITELTEELRTYFGAPLDQGVLVAKIEKDSPADKAGVQVGDVIIDVDGEPITETMDVINTLGQHKAGDQVPVVVIRNGAKTTLTATVAEATGGSQGLQGPQGPQGPQGMLPGGRGMRMWRMDPNDPDLKGFGFGFGGDDEQVQKLEQRVQELEKRLEKLENGR